MKNIISILFFLGALLHASAQPPKQYTFTHYSTATGLQSNQVNSVVQDEAGYIWIATTEGIVRFDGTRYKNFQHSVTDSSSIPLNTVWQLLIDKKKNLWLLTANGRVGIFNKNNFRFRETTVISKNESAIRSGSKRLLTDDAGNIFLLIGANEILTLNEHRNEFAAAHNFFPPHGNWGYTAFAQQPGTQKYWMGIQGGGIAIYNKATGHLSYADNNIEDEPAVEKYGLLNISSNFLFDKKGRVWFSTWGPGFPYVHCYDLKSNTVIVDKYEFFSTFKTYNEIQGIFEQEDGTIWIRGLKVFGRFLEKEKKFDLVIPGYQNERSIDYRVITCLLEDNEMNIWVGTANNGMFRFNPSQEFFTNVRHTSRATNTYGDGNPISYLLDKDGTLLVGAWGDGLYRYDKNFNTIPLHIKGIGDKNFFSIWSMCPSRDSNTAWFSSQPGIYKYNRDQHAATYYNPSILENRTIRQIAEDKNGNLWLGMQAIGVFKWNAAKGKRKFEDGVSRVEAIPHVQINHISIDSNGYVWIATASDGLYVMDPVTDNVLMHFHDKAKGEQHLMEEGVSAVLEYNDSLMVITTSTRILLYNRLRKITKILGTPETTSGFIASLQKDDRGNLWISTTTALYRATIKTRVFVRFNRDDGITNDYFTLAASYKLPDGRLLFGSSGQFVLFNPASISVSTMIPNISITDFKVMNRSLPVDSLMQLKQIELGYEANSLSVDFSTLTYISANLIQYKLENIDKTWKTADKNNDALYPYLPPGRYELQFRTIDADGKIKLSALQLAIRINPPFWRTWWFYSLLLLLVGGFLFWLDKARTQRKEAVQKMRSDIAGNLHEEINTALNNINILSEMAKLKADNEPQKSKEFIEQIHSKSHNMIIAMDDMLWSISPDNDSMGKTVARMQEFIDSMNNRRGTANQMRADDKVKMLNVNMQFRHEAFLLFKECIIALLNTGIIVYTIHLTLEKPNLVYKIGFSSGACDKADIKNMLEKLERSKHGAAIDARLHVQAHINNPSLEWWMQLE